MDARLLDHGPCSRPDNPHPSERTTEQPPAQRKRPTGSHTYQRGSLNKLISGVQRAPPAGISARLSVEIVEPTRFHSESFSEAPIPSADGKEVGQYFRPAGSTPHPALTPCRASPVGRPGTPRRGIPPCVTCAIFSSKVASESLRTDRFGW